MNFSGKLDVVKATMTSILKTVLVELICYSLDVVKFNLYEKKALEWLYMMYDFAAQCQDKLLWMRLGGNQQVMLWNRWQLWSNSFKDCIDQLVLGRSKMRRHKRICNLLNLLLAVFRQNGHMRKRFYPKNLVAKKVHGIMMTRRRV